MDLLSWLQIIRNDRIISRKHGKSNSCNDKCEYRFMPGTVIKVKLIIYSEGRHNLWLLSRL